MCHNAANVEIELCTVNPQQQEMEGRESGTDVTTQRPTNSFDQTRKEEKKKKKRSILAT
eukprot:m.121853 g.121853  ORF g.121853 m.121853 type:complete len:59 (+) comp13711_c1_seq1:151-327(+)